VSKKVPCWKHADGTVHTFRGAILHASRQRNLQKLAERRIRKDEKIGAARLAEMESRTVSGGSPCEDPGDRSMPELCEEPQETSCGREIQGSEHLSPETISAPVLLLPSPRVVPRDSCVPTDEEESFTLVVCPWAGGCSSFWSCQHSEPHEWGDDCIGEPQSFETICPTCQTPREEGCDAPAE